MGWTPPHLVGIDVPDWKCRPPVDREKESSMKLIRVGVDLAKNVFQVHGVDRSEKAVWRRKLARDTWLKVLLETIEPGYESAHGPPSRTHSIGRDGSIAACHSTIRSARCSSDGGIVRPSALAVLRLTTSSGLDDCSTGR